MIKRYLSAKEDNQPTSLKPDDKEGQCGKTPVDGIIIRDLYLKVDIATLDKLVNRSGDNCRQDPEEKRTLVFGIKIYKKESKIQTNP